MKEDAQISLEKIQLYLNFYKFAINVKSPSWKSGAKIDIYRILNIVDIQYPEEKNPISMTLKVPPPPATAEAFSSIYVVRKKNAYLFTF